MPRDDTRHPLPPGFRWPDGVRAAALFSFDVDAEAVMLGDHPETGRYLDVIAHQRYGPKAAVPRILRMLDRLRLRTTFFVPGWVAETWPDVVRSVRDAGHEIGHHGYLHESVRGVDEETELGYLRRGLAALDEVLGLRPIGYRAPSWDMNFRTPALLAREGFRYDSGLMDADHPYRLATSAEPGAPTLVELPVHWSLDDWNRYNFVPGYTSSSPIALGAPADRAKDTLGRVYEYFLAQFASAEGKKGGQFYTPSHVVRILVEMLAPYRGRVYDPCCGSGGMFVSSEKFIEAHSGRLGDISIYGQESNYTTWRLAAMNLAIRGIDAQIAHGDTFHNDRHPDLKADWVLANPPFNDSDWRGELLKGDKRWLYGVPPAGNANFAWVQHFISHLAPTGIAGFVLANGSMSTNQSGEGEIRKAIIEADLVDAMVALPGQLFYSTQIPVCLWFLARDRRNGRFRDRRGETLFIDARKMGTLVDRTHRELTDDDVATIAGTYHAWRGDEGAGEYADVAGFCRAAPLDEIRKHGHVLTPGRYVGAAAAEEDAEPFDEKMRRLTATLREQQAEGARLDDTIRRNLQALGYDD